jgi:hypothetical protein
MRTGKQLIKEFWPQTLLSVLWGLYKVYITTETDNKISVFVTNFSGALFLLSWMFGQVIRINKQQKIEDEFGQVKTELKKLLDQIEKQTQDLIGYATGGDSVAYFQPSFFKPTELTLDVINISKYPVFDFSGEWIDIDESINPEIGKLWTRHNFMLGEIYPNKIAMGVLKFDLTNKDRLRINIFSRTRNGGISQTFRIIKVGGQFKVAYKTTSENFNEVRIPDDFPDYDPKTPEKVFQ